MVKNELLDGASFYPGNRVLLGRQNVQNIRNQRTTISEQNSMGAPSNLCLYRATLQKEVQLGREAITEIPPHARYEWRAQLSYDFWNFSRNAAAAQTT